MKRYDLYGGSKACEQFGSKQFWVVTLNSRFDCWVSYNTVVAVVDNEYKKVIEGRCARGFSRTTSKQFNQALYTYAQGYKVINYESEEYHKFNYDYKCAVIDIWGNTWDKKDNARNGSYYLGCTL